MLPIHITGGFREDNAARTNTEPVPKRNHRTEAATEAANRQNQMPGKCQWKQRQAGMPFRNRSAATAQAWKEKPPKRKTEKVMWSHTAGQRSTQAHKPCCASGKQEDLLPTGRPKCRMPVLTARNMQERSGSPCATSAANQGRKTVPRNNPLPTVKWVRTALQK